MDSIDSSDQAAPQPAICLRGLCKSYDRVQALRGVDLDVRRGEVFGFLGPNGAGKTTTIRCLLDLIRPDRGTVRVLGIDPQQDPVAVRSRVGYLPGELHLEDNFTAGRLFRLFDAFRGGGTDFSFVRELCDRLELNTTQAIRNLSKGNKQKVGVVQAFMHAPELLLLDEPTAGLDPLMQQEVLTLVREARDRGATVFFSSHVLSEVEAACERFAIVRRGVVVEVADTSVLDSRRACRAVIRFAQRPDARHFAGLPGVRLLDHRDRTLRVQVDGSLNPLLRALAQCDVQAFETEHVSLEELFLAYYEGDASTTGGPEGAPAGTAAGTKS